MANVIKQVSLLGEKKEWDRDTFLSVFTTLPEIMKL